MAKKTFNEVGDTEDKVTWNAAGTRKWRMTYTLLEVQPSWRRKAKTEATAEGASNEEASKQKPKKATNSKKPKTSKSNNAKSTKAKAE